MLTRQRLCVLVGTGLIGVTSFFRPCESPGGLLSNDLTYMPWGSNLRGADLDLRYLPQLHVTLVLFCILLTVLLAVVSGEGATKRQKEVALLVLPSLALLGIVAYPSSLALMCGAYLWPEPFVGSADVVLTLILTFMMYLRHDAA